MFENLFENAPEPLIVISRDKKIVKYNKKAEELFNSSIFLDCIISELNFINTTGENIFQSPLFDSYFEFEFENREITFKKSTNFVMTFLLSFKKYSSDNKDFLFLSFKNISDMVSFKNIFEELYDSLTVKTIELDHVISEKEKAYKLLKQKDDEMLRQLNLAHEVQEGIFPEINERINGYFFTSKLKPASIVSGDLLAILDTDGKYFDFVIADVTGHGVPSALITMMLKMSFQTRIEEIKIPELIVEAVNNDMHNVLSNATIFVTLLFARLEYETGLIDIIDCGHTPPIIVKSNNTIEKPDINGMMLGVLEELDYGKMTIKIDKGDTIVFLTDGIVEAQNDKSEFYEDIFMERIKNLNLLKPELITKDIFDGVYEFSKSEELADDATIFCIKKE